MIRYSIQETFAFTFGVEKQYKENKVKILPISYLQYFHLESESSVQFSRSVIPVHQQLLELVQLMSIELVVPSNHLILSRPLLFLPSIFPSIRVFSSESALHIRWPVYWNFSFSINPSSEYSGLVSFRMDWFDFLASQGTLKSFLQHRSSEASVLMLSCSFFFYRPALTSLHDHWKNHGFD